MRSLCAIFIVLAGLSAAGCVTETRPIENMPPMLDSGNRRGVRTTPPAGLEPEVLFLSAATPMDSDGNGFADTVPVVVYVFGNPERYELPIGVEGDFAFRMVTPEGDRIGQWVFAGEEADRARQAMPPGPGYVFGLRLGPGRDVLDPTTALLSARFRRADGGGEIGSNGAAEIRLGPLGTR